MWPRPRAYDPLRPQRATHRRRPSRAPDRERRPGPGIVLPGAWVISTYTVRRS
ncbi:hypothetical protein F750_0488 [Streptomyces sp. PAMC 26508]|nr:hypothetical protein F750_0488 [Streptomyces sp. PAMC 26508]